MGKTFFNGWALWEKMTFVLACAIALTFCAGALKLWYTHRKTRKYSAIQAIQAKSASIKRSLSRRSTTKTKQEPMREKRSRKEDNEVPFGIRAIESGIEVEGVWISRSNTPASTRESSVMTFTAFRNQLPRHNSTVDLSKLEAQTDEYSGDIADSRPTSMGSDRPTRYGYHHPTSSASESGPSAPPSPEIQPVNPMRSRYPPHSYARYEGVHYARTSQRTPSNQSDPFSSGGSTQRSSSRSRSGSEALTPNGARSESSRNSSSGSNGSNEINPQQMTFNSPQPRTPRHADLDLLQEHRLSHVAETGQLLPRARKPGYSGEWASMANHLPTTPSPATGLNGVGPSDCSTQVSSPKLPVPTEVTPRYSFEDPKIDDSQPQPTHSSTWSYATPTRPPRAYSPPSSDHHHTRSNDSHVLRHVNSGFAILKPGTLDAQPPQTVHHADSRTYPQTRRSRTTSMGRAGGRNREESANSWRGRERSSDGESVGERRRLQKKRPSEESKRSSFEVRRVSVGTDAERVR